VQPYDAAGNPLVRDPSGQLINAQTAEVVPITEPRFSATGETLDPFNRPLPPNAAAMYTEQGVPIGVGPDGRHYTPDGEEVSKSASHYDGSGKTLPTETVTAADEVAPTIAVAVKVRAALKGDANAAEVVDPLGRAFRSHGENDSVTADGTSVPTSARRVEVGGKLMTYEEAKKQEAVKTVQPATENGSLSIKIENEDGEIELGTVEVDGTTTLSAVRLAITSMTTVPDFTFLADGVSISSFEERTKLAIKFMPELSIRGKELKTEQASAFKATAFQKQTEEKKKEEEEFHAIMNRVRNKTFLHHVGRDLTQ